MSRVFSWAQPHLNRHFFGGDSSSSSTTTNIDKRLVTDGQSVGVSADRSTVNVTATDQGAVKAGTETANRAIDGILAADARQGDTLEKLLTFADSVFKSGAQNLSTTATGLQNAYDSARVQNGDGAQLVKVVAIAAGALVLSTMVKKGGSK